MYAPRMTGTVWTPAQNWLQQVSAVLKPSMSCSWPNTTTSLALRAASVRGTLAHDCANGAADRVALLETLVDAVAVAATATTASTTPARSHRRLCIEDVPPLVVLLDSHLDGFHSRLVSRGGTSS